MPVHALAARLRDLFRSSASRGTRPVRRPATARLELVALEERSLLAANASGAVTGFVFVDSNRNNVRDAGERGLPGVDVTLLGTSNGGNVRALSTTAADGSFRFDNVQPGTYTANAGPVVGFLGYTSSIQTDVGPGGVTVVGFADVTGGQTVQTEIGFPGVAPEFISRRLFLASTTDASFPFADPGTGVGQASDRENNAPTLKNAIANVNPTGANPADTIIDLAGHFDDTDLTNSQIRFNTSAGTINVELFDRQTPRTVANFFNYILSDRFDNTIFHRLVSNFVLQGGGFEFKTGPSRLDSVDTDPTVQNEFQTLNTRGTIAMAKVGNDPNSATSQFFFNLANNTNLNTQNGGFTVFGRLVGTADQSTIDALARLTIRNLSGGDPNSPFASVPLSNYTGTNFPTDTTASNYALVRDVTVVRRAEFLTYTVVSNSNPNIVAARIEDNRLILDHVANRTGTATITIRATDRFGASVLASFQVTR